MYRPKPYCISRKSVQEAYLKIKANKGAAGVDKMSMEAFDMQSQKYLYKLWNQMSSGSYMPPAIKLVEVPKKDGGKRPLGINYYGKFYSTKLKDFLRRVNSKLANWAIRKYKGLRVSFTSAMKWIRRLHKRKPNLFAHWTFGSKPTMELR